MPQFGPSGEPAKTADAGGDPSPSPTPSPDPGDSPDLGDPADLAPSSATPQNAMLEAESGTLSGGFTQADDAAASGGKYLVAPAGAVDGKAVFSFNAAAAGNYVIWGRVLAPTDANNSFHTSVDTDTVDNDATDNASTIWDLPISTVWTWVKVNTRGAAGNTDVTLPLTAGSHMLYVNFREVGAQLDRLIITSDPAFTPPP